MKVKVGDIVKVTFLDHCAIQGGDTPLVPLRFETYGRVIVAHKDYLTLATWIDPAGSVDDNTETFVILRSTIEQLRRLR